MSDNNNKFLGIQEYPFDFNIVLNNNGKLAEVKKIIKEYLRAYEDTPDSQKDPSIVASLLGIVQYELQNKSIINPRTSVKYSIKFLGNKINCICVFNTGKYFSKKKSEEDNDNTTNPYSVFDISGLPEIAEILDYGVNLSLESIKLRINWMTSVSYEFKQSDFDSQITDKSGLMERLLKSLVQYRKVQYEMEWQKIIRCFLTGLVMNDYLNDILLKKRKKNKVNKEKSSKAPKISKYVDEQMNILSKCSSSILKENTFIETYTKILTLKFNLIDDKNFEFQESEKQLIKDIKTDLKISYLLYQFVKMYGLIVLVSFPLVTEKYLLSKLNFKDLDGMRESFETILKRDKFAEAIINANNDHGEKIIDAIKIYVKLIKAEYNLFVTKIDAIKDKYDFKLSRKNHKEISHRKRYSSYSENDSVTSQKRVKVTSKSRHRTNKPKYTDDNKENEVNKDFLKFQQKLEALSEQNKRYEEMLKIQNNEPKLDQNNSQIKNINQIRTQQEQKQQANLDPSQTQQSNQLGDIHKQYISKNLQPGHQHYVDPKIVEGIEERISKTQNENNIANVSQNYYKLEQLQLKSTQKLSEDEKNKITNSIKLVESALNKNSINLLTSRNI